MSYKYKPRIFFVCVANNAIGYGHLNRCLSLATHWQQRKADIHFLLFGNATARVKLDAAGFSSTLFTEGSLSEVTWSGSGVGNADVTVVDIFYSGLLSQHQPHLLFSGYRKLSKILIAIDALGEETIVRRFPDLDADFVVSPYVAFNSKFQKARWKLLEGSSYAILAPEYANLPMRQQRLNARRVLVSCGGSDPNDFTLNVLRGLDEIIHQLEIRVVIGPMFKASLRVKVEYQAARSKHIVELVETPNGLLSEMLWCDLAVSASGLTKYELAATGTPALLFSVDAYHNLVNRAFSEMRTTVDLGIGVAPEVVAFETERLLSDLKLRNEMSLRGKMLIDGMGASRLLDKIEKELSC